MFDPHQHTIKHPTSCCGIGLHSGRTANLTIKPAPVDNGIRFFRTDLGDNISVKAHMDKVIDTRLATTIGEKGAVVATTEHLLAALRSSDIDNVDIEIDSSEVPIMDGSAEPFIKLLKSAGKTRQEGLRKLLRITRPITYSDRDTTIVVTPYNGFKVTGEISFDDALIKTQTYTIDFDPERFCREIARARTFGYVEQVEELWANGLALGGTLENVIAIHWNRTSVLNEDGLRYQDEFIRHKVLDLVGDLTLLGCPLLGHVSAYKAGHSQHLGFMEAIADAPDCWELIELEKNGCHAVIDRKTAMTRTSDALVMPFFRGRHSDALPAAC
ncbi:UDP-3-O-acyl-N-acetylglucosamine deacetylase [Desulfofustis glycolicus]|nr:UDP-3-O-acyl-N-acetylglucosamine deacetylase [Desulfofustis glycolicus]